MFTINSFQIQISYTIVNTITSGKIKEIVKTLSIEEKKLAQDNHLMIIDAGGVAGLKHLKACIHFAIQSFQEKTNLAKSLNTEILLYLSGYRQISKAIEKIGLNENSKNILCIHIQKTESKAAVFFNFEQFLSERAINYSVYQTSVEYLPNINENKIKDNLEIAESEITLYLVGSDSSREEIIEKIAIEKSALLNLLK